MNGLIREEEWYVDHEKINQSRKEIAVSGEASVPIICTKTKNDTVNTRKKVEQVNSKRNRLRTQLVYRKHMTFKEVSEDDSLSGEFIMVQQAFNAYH